MQITKFLEHAQAGVTIYRDEAGEPWLSAKQICERLDIINVSQACESLPKEDRTTISLTYSGQDGRSRPVSTLLVSEAGFYQLVFKSRKEEALAFQREVSKLLVQFRKGAFGQKTTLPQDYLSALKALVASEEAKQLLESENKAVKLNNDKLASEVLELKPKADYAEAIQSIEGEMNLTTTAKLYPKLIKKPSEFVAWASDKYCYLGNLNGSKPAKLAYQEYINRGWFVVKLEKKEVNGKEILIAQTLTTEKGRQKIVEQWCKVGAGR